MMSSQEWPGLQDVASSCEATSCFTSPERPSSTGIPKDPYQGHHKEPAALMPRLIHVVSVKATRATTPTNSGFNLHPDAAEPFVSLASIGSFPLPRPSEGRVEGFSTQIRRLVKIRKSAFGGPVENLSTLKTSDFVADAE